jgi:hypothetical protein
MTAGDHSTHHRLRSPKRYSTRQSASNGHGSYRLGENVPGENVPGENVPGENVPGENVPGENVPGENVPGENVPGENAGQGSTMWLGSGLRASGAWL